MNMNATGACYLKYVKCINIQPQSHKKIISFSLYGTTSQYSKTRGFYKGIYVNYHSAKKLYPGWTVRVYMPFDEPAHIIDELSQIADLELILVETNICLRAIRFLPHDDENVSVWLSRDLDSILNEREQVAVSDWLTNYPTKELHIMADHDQHYWTIAGGMFGIHNEVKRKRVSGSGSSSTLIDFIMIFSKKVSNMDEYAVDCVICEHFFFKDDNYIQHYGSGKLLENSKPFPPHSSMNCSNFVGDIVDIHAIYSKLNATQDHPGLRNKKTMTLANNDVFYYPPWNANCVVHWYSETDFTLTPIQTNKSTSAAMSCLKTENGNGIALLTGGDAAIPVVWDGQEQKHAYMSDENTITLIHGSSDSEHYHFTRVHRAFIQTPDALYWMNPNPNRDPNSNSNSNSKCVPNDDAKYVIVTPWPGGLSNVRLSFELSCALAYCTRRTLVVPDLCYIDHLPQRMCDLRLFFDFNDLGISVMTFSEFCNEEHVSDVVSEIPPSFSPHNFDTCHKFIDLCRNADGNGFNLPCFANRTAVTLDHDAKYLHFDKCLLGSFYSMLRHSNEDEANRVKRYVHKHVHYRSEIFESAMKVVRWLKHAYCDSGIRVGAGATNVPGAGEYYAVHMRRGDFLHCDYKTTCISIEDVIKNIEPHIATPTNACIYIATDSVDLSELNAIQQKYNAVTFRDALRHMDAVDIMPPVFHGIIEQIICSQGVKFFSHPLSTFSNYVHRLRGYMPHISDKFCYPTNSTEQLHLTMRADWGCASNVWSKEFLEGFM